mmetsp:Transcript_14725/g.31562  ORF Transcript_14725/g.31562 Transcript_14725/m.31562 type:complete len:120 (-) Transcript_14725:213-572(-)
MGMLTQHPASAARNFTSVSSKRIFSKTYDCETKNDLLRMFRKKPEGASEEDRVQVYFLPSPAMLALHSQDHVFESTSPVQHRESSVYTQSVRLKTDFGSTNTLAQYVSPFIQAADFVRN